MNICTKKKLYHQIDFFHRVFGQKMCGKSWRITWLVPRRIYSNFRSNDVLFLEKGRVVFEKVTCRFRKNDVSFLRECGEGGGREQREMNCKNTCNGLLSRVRMRARFTRVFAFLLSQVSQFFCKSIEISVLDVFYAFFYKMVIHLPKIILGDAED